MLPLLANQELLGHIDGSVSPPPKTVLVESKDQPNPVYSTWFTNDQQAILILHASLTEEAMSEILGLSIALQIWEALEAAYSNTSLERMHLLRDNLRHLTKGSSTIAEYGRKFKSICDQLSAIGHHVTDTDKTHWFLCGLGSTFENWSTAIRTSHSSLPFRDLLTKAESQEQFLASIHPPSTLVVAFAAHHNRPHGSSYSRSKSGSGTSRNSSSSAPSKGNRRPLHCQLCRTNGHYANKCPKLSTFVASASGNDDIARAFHAQCHVSNDNDPDWAADSGADLHMTDDTGNLHSFFPYKGSSSVTFGNGHSSPITHKGRVTLQNNVHLKDVLVVPSLTRNLLSISKLTNDFPVDVLFSNSFFVIQDRTTRKPLAQGRCENGLYLLRDKSFAFVASVSSNKASFELWHYRLGHVAFDTISIMKRLGHLSFTSILPKPNICSPCQLAKAKKLPFANNDKRASNPLDLVHCDLWGPSPITSKNGYKYYVVFVDDYSRFSWLYPLKTKTDFYAVLQSFLRLVQTQLSRKVKNFQSDGGTKFVNKNVRNIFDQNGTFHRLSCPYTAPQNARAERKHRHIVETGLVMLFHASVPINHWDDAFSTATYIINRVPTKVLDNKSPYEMLFSITPTYNNFRVFGCCVYPYLRDYAHTN
ncbi:putative RNA-directed DNA polymerase [Helianthus anomalus]